MLYTEVEMGNNNVVNVLDVLEQDENNKTITDICVKESKRLNTNLINLEELCEFVINNNINFDSLVEEVSYLNGIDLNTISFTVYPITLYENKEIYNLILELQEEGKDIYIISEPRSEIAYAFDLIIQECLKTDSIIPLEYIEYVCFHETENVPQNIVNNIKDTSEKVINRAKNLINTTIKSGKNASKQVINKLESTINSLKKQSKINPRQNNLINDLISKATEIKSKLVSKLNSNTINS